MNEIKDFNKHYVLDTNVILNDAKSIIKFSEKSSNLIILPEIVLDEIDSKKTGFEEINFQAREFARMLSDSQVLNKRTEDIKDGLNRNHIIRIYINGGLDITIDIVSKDFYADSSSFATNIINDRKILEVTKDCESLYNTEIEFISSDIMARTRAISLDIKTSDVLGDKHNKFEYEFHRELKIKEELNIKNLDGKDILLLDKKYKPNYYSYTIKFESEQTCYGYVLNGKFNLINPERDFKALLVKPISVEQKFLCSSLLDPNIDIVVVDAKAGSGKTLLALSAGIRMCDLKKYSKILYIRNSIESLDKGEDVGYLPGLEEKFKIYNHPLYDSLDFIARENFKNKKTQMTEEVIQEEVDRLKSKYNINTMWVGEMRGRTISNAYVIIDESQNLSSKTIQLILSRLDKTCKVVIVGSNAQIDNIYVNKYTNGLTKTLQATYTLHDEVKMFACKLNKVYRGPITEWAERIFT